MLQTRISPNKISRWFIQMRSVSNSGALLSILEGWVILHPLTVWSAGTSSILLLSRCFYLSHKLPQNSGKGTYFY